MSFAHAEHPALLTARARSAQTNAAWADAVARLVGGLDPLTDPDALVARAQALLAGSGWIEPLIAPLIAALRADPWFEPALRVTRDPLRTGLVLADGPAMTLTASVTSAATLAAAQTPATVVFTGRRTVTRFVRGGGALMRRWHAPPVEAATAPCREIAPLRLREGAVIVQDGRTEGHLIVAAAHDPVAVTATVKHGAAPLMREYSIRDGRLTRTACAADSASRCEMLLSFLRASGRTDAGPGFEATTRHPAFHLRWAAMREWLMLDAAAARPRLAEMATADPSDDVRGAARTTLVALDRRLAAR